MLALLIDESGQGGIEYALVLALVASGVVAALFNIGHKINDLTTAAAAQLPDGGRAGEVVTIGEDSHRWSNLMKVYNGL
ncbi:MAG TPA: hypothetical protein VME66_02040 [Candidatus Acidoferrales bacterium]|nr:hypothetical protein [Candidatus Acidoferrales bacterium]